MRRIHRIRRTRRRLPLKPNRRDRRFDRPIHRIPKHITGTGGNRKQPPRFKRFKMNPTAGRAHRSPKYPPRVQVILPFVEDVQRIYLSDAAGGE
jgi:hypothetical protein